MLKHYLDCGPCGCFFRQASASQENEDSRVKKFFDDHGMTIVQLFLLLLIADANIAGASYNQAGASYFLENYRKDLANIFILLLEVISHSPVKAAREISIAGGSSFLTNTGLGGYALLELPKQWEKLKESNILRKGVASVWAIAAALVSALPGWEPTIKDNPPVVGLSADIGSIALNSVQNIIGINGLFDLIVNGVKELNELYIREVLAKKGVDTGESASLVDTGKAQQKIARVENIQALKALKSKLQALSAEQLREAMRSFDELTTNSRRGSQTSAVGSAFNSTQLQTSGEVSPQMQKLIQALNSVEEPNFYGGVLKYVAAIQAIASWLGVLLFAPENYQKTFGSAGSWILGLMGSIPLIVFGIGRACEVWMMGINLASRVFISSASSGDEEQGAVTKPTYYGHLDFRFAEGRDKVAMGVVLGLVVFAVGIWSGFGNTMVTDKALIQFGLDDKSLGTRQALSVFFGYLPAAFNVNTLSAIQSVWKLFGLTEDSDYKKACDTIDAEIERCRNGDEVADYRDLTAFLESASLEPSAGMDGSAGAVNIPKLKKLESGTSSAAQGGDYGSAHSGEDDHEPATSPEHETSTSYALWAFKLPGLCR